jgi:hypothetical protein
MEYTVTRQELAAQPVLVVRRRVRRAEIAATIGAALPKVFLHAQQRGLAIAGYPLRGNKRRIGNVRDWDARYSA